MGSVPSIIRSEEFSASSRHGLRFMESAGFAMFSPQHLVTLTALLGLGILVVRARRRKWVGTLIGVALTAYALAIYSQKAMAGDLAWDSALPLELCHWVMAACVVSLFRPYRWATEIAYYWGFAGTLQAVLTPDLADGFPSWEFLQFFWSHGGILLGIVFLVARPGFRAEPGAVARMFAAVNVYALVVGTLNWIFGWNYGYLCGKPARPSLLDLLGPWPWYLLSLEGVALGSFWLLHQLLGRLRPPLQSATDVR